MDQLAEIIAYRYFGWDGVIEPHRIADDYNVTYSTADYGDGFDGLLMYRQGGFHIFVNLARQQTELRRRFTFCHELGHFFIDGHRTALASGEVPYLSSFTNFSSESVVEREADFFASCLLMPRRRVISDYRCYRKFSFAIVDALSQKYQMSQTAVVYRLLYLNLHPMMIIKAQDGAIVSILKSDDFYFYPKGKKDFIPDDTLMHAVLSGDKPSGNTDQLWIGDWFNSLKRENEKMYEHCIYYRHIDTCYSILWQD